MLEEGLILSDILAGTPSKSLEANSVRAANSLSDKSGLSTFWAAIVLKLLPRDTYLSI